MKFLDRFVQARRLLVALERIATALESTAVSLDRIAVVVAPEKKDVPDQEVRTSSALTYSRDTEQARIVDFTAKMLRDLGREPTEDEILEFLDGKIH